MRTRDLTGRRFTRLEVISFSHRNINRYLWNCKCDCGNHITVRSCSLLMGKTKSCGCLRKEKFSRTTHGLSKTRLYSVWGGMNERCYHQNSRAYKWYGAKGIVICDEWRNDFMVFYNWAIENGYNKNLTIDRIDNNGNYEPSNCRWTTMDVQNQNTSRTKLNRIKVSEIRSLIKTGKIHEDIAAMYGVSYTTISQIKANRIWK